LYELQEVDWKLDSRSTRLGDVEKLLEDQSLLKNLQAHLTSLDGELAQSQADLKKWEIESESHQEKASKVEAKLYGGAVVNPRELADLQEELQQIRRLQKPVEDDALTCMESIEELDRQIGAAKLQLDDVTQKWHSAHETLTEERTQLQSEILSLQKQREGLVPDLGVVAVDIYEKIRRVRQGYAVAKVERDMCLGCRIRLPSHELQKVKARQDLVQCTSCNRILFVS
jgi:predicted  nucleic acid-binding Zn-ribbon protein